MKTVVRLAVAILAGPVLFSAALATEHLCRPFEARQLVSLNELPRSIQSSLGTEKLGTSGIADRGQPFNKTDVIREELPFRRFSLAAASAKCILVAVERGGRGYSVEVLAFELLLNGTWQSGASITTEHLPRSVPELLALVPG